MDKLLRTALIELHYLPCIAYFSALSGFEEILVEKFEHYEKQSFRNRCYIRGPQKVEVLTLPVTGKHGRPTTAGVRIDYTQKWLNNHWRSIRTAYGSAPFFEYYAEELHDILFKKPVFLYDLNLEIMTLCLKWLKKEPKVMQTQVYEPDVPAGIADLRAVINPKNPEGCNRFYKSIEYSQVFGSNFVPNLSLIDLVFTQGPGAWSVVKASSVK